MRELFGHHHRMSDRELGETWKQCIFSLDTNALLNIYRYADQTREDFFRVLGHLRDRVWVPFQVAREFYRHRIGVILEQQAKYSELAAALDRAVGGLRDGAFRKSGFLRLEEVEAILEPAVQRAKAHIEERKRAHPSLLQEDPYLDTIAGLVGDRVGQEPSAEEFEQRCLEAQSRIERSQPPGYRDLKKPKPDCYGDVLIWFELLDLAKSTKRPVAFVTDDDKDDWWHIIQGEKQGPRAELREEMRRSAGVDFAILKPARLLALASRELSNAVSDSSIADAQQIAEQLKMRVAHWSAGEQMPEAVREDFLRPRAYPSFSRVFGRQAEAAVGVWLRTEYEGAEVLHLEGAPFDFLVRSDRGSVGVDARYLHHMRPGAIVNRVVRESFLRAYFEITERRVDDCLVVLATPGIDVAHACVDALLRRQQSGPTYTVVIGVFDQELGFQELHRIPPGDYYES